MAKPSLSTSCRMAAGYATAVRQPGLMPDIRERQLSLFGFYKNQTKAPGSRSLIETHLRSDLGKSNQIFDSASALSKKNTETPSTILPLLRQVSVSLLSRNQESSSSTTTTMLLQQVVIELSLPS